jgi:hypothetical protein
MRYTRKIKGMGYILWQARHEFYHMLLGVAWAWFLRELWGEFNLRWLFLAIFGSLLPDFDHLIYFFTYGKTDWYSKEVKQLLRSREWRTVFHLVSHGHKHNTELMSHNIYVIIFLIISSFFCLLLGWHAWLVVFGAMLTHFFFDMVDDYLVLGYLNQNWKRWGRSHQRIS